MSYMVYKYIDYPLSTKPLFTHLICVEIIKREILTTLFIIDWNLLTTAKLCRLHYLFKDLTHDFAIFNKFWLIIEWEMDPFNKFY